MPQRTCSLDGCDRKHYAHDMCNLHWNRLRTRGTTDDPPPPATECQAPGCEKPNTSGRHCPMHTARLAKYGSYDLPAKPPKVVEQCAVDGCERPVRTAPWCNAHYQRYLRSGDPLGTRPEYDGCSVAGCERAHAARGYCQMHGRRVRLYGDPHSLSRAFAREAPPPCPAEGCTKPARSFHATYCADHIGSYRYTAPSAPKPVKPHRPTCKIDDCEKTVSAHGMCQMHANRVKRHGDPHIVTRKATRFAPERICFIEDCERAVAARDRCTRHYNAWQTGDEFEPAPRERWCDVEGCARPHFAHGYCSTHSKRLILTGDVHADLPIGFALPKPLRCTAPGCTNWQASPGLCIQHHGQRRGWSVWNLLEESEDDTDDYLAVIHGDPCVYCGGEMQHVDHIKPKSKGGPDHWSNFAPACQSCNCSKHVAELLPYLLRRLTRIDPVELPIGA